MLNPFTQIRPLAAGLLAFAMTAGAHAAQVQVQVTVENLAPSNSITFAPLHLGFHSGTFDAFNIGQSPTAPIISVAEGGSGSAWLPAFAAADPTATIGTIGMPLFPGMSRSASFVVDTAVNRYFTFASMVVPSNDFFIGNDSPTRHELFDATGNLIVSSIPQLARQIWDAGSEVFDPAAAAFVGNNDLRTNQNSVVAFNFAELAAFNGLGTAAGYTFGSQLNANTEVYRISFEVSPVPEPASYAMLLAGLAVVGSLARRRATRGSNLTT